MKVLTHETDDGLYLRYYCPGCKHDHTVPAERWHWNKDVDKPTLSPSIRHRIQSENGTWVTTCHYHIQNGYIKYCDDCQHGLNGATIEMEEMTA